MDVSLVEIVLNNGDKISVIPAYDNDLISLSNHNNSFESYKASIEERNKKILFQLSSAQKRCYGRYKRKLILRAKKRLGDSEFVKMFELGKDLSNDHAAITKLFAVQYEDELKKLDIIRYKKLFSYLYDFLSGYIKVELTTDPSEYVNFANLLYNKNYSTSDGLAFLLYTFAKSKLK